MKSIQFIKLTVILMAIALAGPQVFSNTAHMQKSTDIHTAFDKDPGKKKKKGKRSRKNCYWCAPVRTFDKGQFDLNIQAGVVPTYVMDHAKIISPPVSAGFDFRVTEKFSIGAMAGYSASESQPQAVGDNAQASWTNNHFTFGLRPGVHITRINNWDFYGGFSFGFNISKISGKLTTQTST